MTPHRVDPVSLVFGLIFVVVGVPFLLDRVDLFTVNWSWAAPVLLIVVGGLLLGSVIRGRSTAPEVIAEVPEDQDL
jgi:hypothetical protein